MGKMNTIFDSDSVEAIFDALEKEGSEWSKKQLETMNKLVMKIIVSCSFHINFYLK